MVGIIFLDDEIWYLDGVALSHLFQTLVTQMVKNWQSYQETRPVYM